MGIENLFKDKTTLIKVGFTGTSSRGMLDIQKESFINLLLSLYNRFEKIEFHHGDCIGSDKEAHDIAKKHGCFIVIHPPINEYKRAFCDGDIILNKKEYLQRNHDIVDSTDILIVSPKTDNQELRSGTWATYRYAVKKGNVTKILKVGK